MLALNALLLTIFVVIFAGVVISLVLGRPLFRAVDRACDSIDQTREAKFELERLEKEEEARHRIQAEKELDEQFPHLKNGAE